MVNNTEPLGPEMRKLIEIMARSAHARMRQKEELDSARALRQNGPVSNKESK